MRPLKLTVEGFGSFKERQEVDFSALDLFAISGPTGAGKTTLLDAMIFALYGKVPRVGREYRDFISLGRERIVATLDFRVQGRRFRVTRRARRSGTPVAQLEELVGDQEISLAGQIGPVNEKIEQLLGLGYEAFTQSVVLPQGEFARFLKSKPGQRNEILRDLLRLQIYERMRVQASRLGEQHEQKALLRDQQLAVEYSGITPEGVAARRQELTDLEETNRRRETELGKGSRALEELRRRRGLTMELDEQQRRQADIAREEATIRDCKAKLAAAQRAAPLIPRFDAVAEAEGQQRKWASRARDAHGVFAQAEKDHRDAEGRLTTAVTAAAEMPGLSARITALDMLRGVLQNRQTERERLAKIAEEVRQYEALHQDNAKQLKARRKDRDKRQEALAQATNDVATIGYDAARAAALDKVRDRATTLHTMRAAADMEVQRLHDLEAQVAHKTKAADEARALVAAAEQSRRDALSQCERAAATLEEAQRRLSALHLRATLALDEPCPVCEQHVTALPSAAAPPELEEPRRALENARKKEKEKADLLAQARAELERATAAAEYACSTASDARAKAEKQAAQLVQHEAELRAANLFPTVDASPVEKRIFAEIAQLDGLKTRHEVAVEKRERTRQALEKVQAELGKLEAEAVRLEEVARGLTLRCDEVQAALDRLEGQIRGVSSHPDPLAEREALAKRHAALGREQEEAHAQEHKACSYLGEARVALQAANERLAEVESLLKRRRDEALAALREAGFADDKEVRAALLTPVEQEAMRHKIEHHSGETHAVSERIREIESSLRGERVEAVTIEKAEREQEGLQALHHRELAQAGRLASDVAVLVNKLAKAQELSQELASTRRAQRLYERLATDLRINQFQEYLLEEVFGELVKGASQRLERLSGRYTLERHKGNFEVVDHDNARERRSTDTLSGGETFLTSLALALELSEQVQRAHGAVVLDSLFIDEGFGTLDPETLKTVAEAIESLPTGGRMVGIITHIGELTEQLPACIRVRKRPEGSTIEVEMR